MFERISIRGLNRTDFHAGEVLATVHYGNAEPRLKAAHDFAHHWILGKYAWRARKLCESGTDYFLAANFLACLPSLCDRHQGHGFEVDVGLSRKQVGLWRPDIGGF